MELKIQSIQFNVTEKLQAFIQKKFAKIAKFKIFLQQKLFLR